MMRFLPQANPLYQHIPTTNVVLPEILNKLGNGGFTGYLHQTSQDFEAYCIFAKGKLICVMATAGNIEKTGFEAIIMMFDYCINKLGEINVYRMTTDLAVCANALVVGKKIYADVEVRQVDIKAMLTQIKNEEKHGVVRFYTNTRYAMMFYHSGIPIGFYHDGASTIESIPDESRRVAALPGAHLDVSISQPLEELLRCDLLQMVNVQKLWENALARSSQQTIAKQQPSSPTNSAADEAKLAELIEDLKEVAMAYLSRPGAQLIDSSLQKVGGTHKLLDNNSIMLFLKEIEAGAKNLDSEAKIEEMLDLIQSEIAGRLAV